MTQNLARSSQLVSRVSLPPSLGAKDLGHEVPHAEDCSPWLLFLG